MMTTKLFISYTTHDADIAKAIRAALTTIGVLDSAIFSTAERDSGPTPGQNTVESIGKALRDADAVICLFSNTYLESPFCIAEAGYSQFSQKIIFTAVGRLSRETLPEPFRSLWQGRLDTVDDCMTFLEAVADKFGLQPKLTRATAAARVLSDAATARAQIEAPLSSSPAAGTSDEPSAPTSIPQKTVTPTESMPRLVAHAKRAIRPLPKIVARDVLHFVSAGSWHKFTENQLESSIQDDGWLEARKLKRNGIGFLAFFEDLERSHWMQREPTWTFDKFFVSPSHPEVAEAIATVTALWAAWKEQERLHPDSNSWPGFDGRLDSTETLALLRGEVPLSDPFVVAAQKVLAEQSGTEPNG